jgi:hypothetical protein
MATKILAHPVDDKRKASVQSTTITLSDSGTANSADTIDIRGFANFTVVFETTMTVAVAIHVSADDTTYVPLYSPGVSGAAVSLAAGVRAYDVPELAGCHYVRFQSATTSGSGGSTDTVTMKIMGKV